MTTDARQQVMASERAFAETMANRDLQGFASFIADEAIFFSGRKVCTCTAAAQP